jgi:arabinose-5-phosphate isomerase
MITDMSAQIGRDVLLQEAAAITRCAELLGPAFEQAVTWAVECKGRVITCGIGKSGHIARKTAGTLSSTGTPSLFLHAAEAVHGDLGMVTDQDVVLLYTHSGETDELVQVVPALRAQGAKTIVMTGRPGSSVGRLVDLVLDTGVEVEACPNNLAPTTSTTVMLALSDALALAIMDRRNFGAEDFARLHPKGALGKRLLLQVQMVMRPKSEIAVLGPSATVMDVVQAMTSAGVGAACIEENGVLKGIVSESDLRRHLLEDRNVLDAPAASILNPNPVTIEPTLLAVEALEVFQNFPAKIGEMPVMGPNGLEGLLVLKDLLRSGII